MTPTSTSPAEEPRPFRDIPRVTKMLLGIMGATARDLGQASGLSESKMSERLSGKTPIRAHELAAWADYLGVDPGLFFANPAELRKRLITPAEQGNAVMGWNDRTSNVTYLADRTEPTPMSVEPPEPKVA